MRISIITPTLNQARFITDTIISVQKQNHHDIEHIVMDGGSTDGTIDILKSFPHLVWKSEKDSGQSNAINKGFKIATGDILAWLNSDDYYAENILGDVAAYFEQHPACFFLYGDITYIDDNKNFRCFVEGDVLSFKKLLANPDIVRQPACFWRKEILTTVGYVNEALHLVMDYEYFLRITNRYEPCYLAKNICYFRAYAENKTNALMKKQVKEIRNIMNRYSAMGPVLFYRFLLYRLYVGLRGNAGRIYRWISGKQESNG
jgi:glycosyltransferase involved in cell wall biosynthesis